MLTMEVLRFIAMLLLAGALIRFGEMWLIHAPENSIRYKFGKSLMVIY